MRTLTNTMLKTFKKPNISNVFFFIFIESEKCYTEKSIETFIVSIEGKRSKSRLLFTKNKNKKETRRNHE